MTRLDALCHVYAFKLRVMHLGSAAIDCYITQENTLQAGNPNPLNSDRNLSSIVLNWLVEGFQYVFAC